MEKKERIRCSIKCFFTGAGMTVPGVSGGSLAMAMGVYDAIIRAVPSLLRKGTFLPSFLFLLGAGCSGMAGALALAPLMSWLITSWRTPIMFFFIGAILGSVPMVVAKSKVGRKEWWKMLLALPGAAIVTALSLLPPGSIALGESPFILQLLAGIALSIGFVLPGVSFSYLLVVLGLYDTLMENLSTFSFLPLIPLALGLLLGIFLLSGALKRAMDDAPGVTFPLILGFLLGSLPTVFPSTPVGAEWIPSILLLFTGFFVIHVTGKEPLHCGN